MHVYALTLLLFLPLCFSPVQERIAHLQGQVTENHRVEEIARNELEGCRLKCFAAEAEKNRAEEKCLEAYNQVDKHIKEAEDAKRQLHEMKVCEDERKTSW